MAVENTSPELKKQLGALYLYLSTRLEIKHPPAKVVFINSEENAKNLFGLTGYYDSTTKTIKIYITGRLDTDILRSFCHEMIHFWQDERGTLPTENHTTGAHYAQEDIVLRKREMEAYLLGSLIFRDWQDENRYGPPPIPPILPAPYD